MAKCPFCHEDLSDTELQAELCMSCGKPLPASQPTEEKAGVGKGPTDASSGTPPDSPGEEPPARADKGHARPQDAAGRAAEPRQGGDTASEDRFAETLDGVPPVSADGPDEDKPEEDPRFASTVDGSGMFLTPEKAGEEDPRLAETLQTDQPLIPSSDQSLSGPPSPEEASTQAERPELPGGAEKPEKSDDTADERRIAATLPDSQALDEPVGKPEAPKEEKVADERVARTIDSTGLGLTPPPDGHDSSRDSLIDQTMDSGDSARFAQTMDSTDSARLEQTMDSGDSARFAQTMDSGGSSRFAATLDSGSVGGAMEERVSMVWSGTFQPQTTPRTSIKAEAQTLETQSHLVIRPRAMLDTQDTGADRADYVVLDKLGEGGMGVVYMARQASIDRTVAVKMLKPSGADNKEERGKFLSEAIVTGELEHPNIVPIYDLGKREDGALFYSMKRVKGTPWDTVIREKSFAENIEILMKVADATAFAHSRGVVHRDLKPENVMLGDFGEVLLMDWGLALSSDADPSTTGMGGTPAYMAPEMATGPIEKIGPGADIYLLGAILFEIVTGKPPHTGKSVMDCLFAAARNEIIPTEHSGELIDIAMKAMATQPGDRHKSVNELQDAIRDYQSHSESISLSTRADEDLVEARQSKNYEDFARSRFGFQEAVNLWDANERAKEGLLEAGYAYAEAALEKGDFDLGVSLLDRRIPTHAELHEKLAGAIKEREARQQRLKNARRFLIGLVATVFLVITVASVISIVLYRQAVASEKIAKEKEAEALLQKGLAEKATVQAEKDAEAARLAKIEADKNAALALQREEQARKAKEKEEYGAYIARIGLAAAKIDENAFDTAEELLNMCPDYLRDWEWGRLYHLCTADSQTYRADWPLECVAMSVDGRHIATGGWNGQVYVSKAVNNQDDVQLGTAATTEHVLDTGGTHVFAVAFSPDGTKLAVGCNALRKYVQIWNVNTGELDESLRFGVKDVGEKQVNEGHTDAVLCVRFSKDGNRLLTSSYDGTARLWDMSSGESLRLFQGHDWWVWSAEFSRDEDRVVTASQDGSAIVWSVDSGDRTPAFQGHSGPVYSAAFSPDGLTVASAGYDKRVLFWEPDELRPVDIEAVLSEEGSPPPKYRVMEGHSAAVRSVAYSREGSLLVTSADDNTVRVWDVATGKTLKILRGHAGRVPACAFCPDLEGPVAAGDDSESPENHVLTASHDQKIKYWSIDGYEEVRVFKGQVFEGHTDEILGADFSPNGEQVVTASLDRSAKLWDLGKGSEIRTLTEGHKFLASAVLVFPDAKYILTAAADNTTRIWDVALGTETMVIDGTGPNAAVALSPDGKWLLTGSATNDALVWNVDTGEELARLRGHNSDVTAVAISPDGKWAFTGDSVGRCMLWDTEKWTQEGWNGQPEWERKSHSRGISAAAFLPSGKRVLTASQDNTVAQWDVESGDEETGLTLKHPGGVNSFAITADGRYAVTSCSDRFMRLWDIEAAKEIDKVAVQQPATADIWKKENQLNRRAEDIERDMRQSMSSIAIDQSDQQVVPRVIAATEDNRVRMWDIADGTFQPDGGDDSMITDLDANVVADLEEIDGLVWSATFVRTAAKKTAPGAQDAAEPGDAGAGQEVQKVDCLLTVGGEEARLWDIKTGKPGMGFGRQGAVASARFSPTDPSVVTASWDNAARIWDPKTGTAGLKLEGGHSGFVNSAVYSPDGKLIVTASDDRTVKVWNAASGTIVSELIGHEKPVRMAVFSPDGKRVLSASDDKTARIWNVATETCLHKLEGHEQAVLAAAFSPDGKLVVTASEDNKARLWNALTGKAIPKPKDDVGDEAAPDAGGAAEPEPTAVGAVLPVSLRLDDAADAAPADEVDGPAAADGNGKTGPARDAGAVGGNPDLAAEAEEDDDALLLAGHTAAVTAVVFSPTGSRVVTASADSTAKVWDTKTGNEILTLRGHSRELTTVSFAPDGRSVLTGSRDGTCILWLATGWDQTGQGKGGKKAAPEVAQSARAK